LTLLSQAVRSSAKKISSLTAYRALIMLPPSWSFSDLIPIIIETRTDGERKFLTLALVDSASFSGGGTSANPLKVEGKHD